MDDVCPTFQPKAIRHEAILDMCRTNHKTFISMQTLKKLKHQKSNVINQSAMSHSAYLFHLPNLINFCSFKIYKQLKTIYLEIKESCLLKKK